MKKRHSNKKGTGKKSAAPPTPYKDDITQLGDAGLRLLKLVDDNIEPEKLQTLAKSIVQAASESNAHNLNDRMFDAVKHRDVMKFMATEVKNVLTQKKVFYSNNDRSNETTFQSLKKMYKDFGLNNIVDEYTTYLLRPMPDKTEAIARTLLSQASEDGTNTRLIKGKDGRKRADASSLFYYYSDPEQGLVNTTTEMYIRKCDLSTLSFSGTSEMPYSFDNLSLRNFAFDYGTLSHCSFDNADLSGCSFENTRFTGSVSFDRAIIDPHTAMTLLPALREAQKNGVKITLNATFIGDFRSQDFSDIDFGQSNFAHADLQGVNATNANFNQAHITLKQVRTLTNAEHIASLSFYDSVDILEFQYNQSAKDIADNILTKCEQDVYQRSPKTMSRSGNIITHHLSPSQRKQFEEEFSTALANTISTFVSHVQEPTQPLITLMYSTLLVDEALPVGENLEYVRFSDMLADRLVERGYITEDSSKRAFHTTLGHLSQEEFSTIIEETCKDFFRDFHYLRFNPLAHPRQIGLVTTHEQIAAASPEWGNTIEERIIPKGSLSTVLTAEAISTSDFLRRDCSSILSSGLAMFGAFLPQAARMAVSELTNWIEPKEFKTQSHEDRLALLENFVSGSLKNTITYFCETGGLHCPATTPEINKIAKAIAQDMSAQASGITHLNMPDMSNQTSFVENIASVFVDYGVIQINQNNNELTLCKQNRNFKEISHRTSHDLTQKVREASKDSFRNKFLYEKEQAIQTMERQ